MVREIIPKISEFEDLWGNVQLARNSTSHPNDVLNTYRMFLNFLAIVELTFMGYKSINHLAQTKNLNFHEI